MIRQCRACSRDLDPDIRGALCWSCWKALPPRRRQLAHGIALAKTIDARRTNQNFGSTGRKRQPHAGQPLRIPVTLDDQGNVLTHLDTGGTD